MDLKETDILGGEIGKHWYYKSKASALIRMLEGIMPKTILDVGAGSGFFSSYLLASSDATDAWCVDIGYDVESDKTEAGKTLHYRRSIDASTADLVLLMDVLEHVDNDIDLLKDYVSKVHSGSRFVITVPAFNFLWSGHDTFLEHKRRYTIKDLEGVVKNSGLKVKHSAYYFGVVFPIAAALRIAQKSMRERVPQSQLKKHGSITNKVLTLLCNLELKFMRHNRVAGLTVFCLAEKP